MKQKSDKTTLKYLMGLMNSLPLKLFRLVRELKENAATINQRVQVLLKDMEGLSTRIDMLTTITEELCDVASAAMAIGPMMKVMEDKDDDESEAACEPHHIIEGGTT